MDSPPNTSTNNDTTVLFSAKCHVVFPQRGFADRCFRKLRGNRPQECEVRLFRNLLIFESDTGIEEVSISDVIGTATEDSILKLFVCQSPKLVEYVQQMTRIDFGDSAIAQKCEDLIQQLTLPLSEEPKSSPKCLILLCPTSGKKEAWKLWNETVKLVFDRGRVQYDIIATEYRLHAYEYVKNLPNLDGIDAIIAAGGDGILHEITNALLERDDWRTARLVPLGHLPFGSGNSLARTLFNTIDAETAAIRLVKAIKANPRGTPHQIISVRGHKSKKLVYSIANIGWSFPADCDIISEKYRWMGSFRFNFVSVMDSIFPTSYSGRFSWLPFGSDPSQVEQEQLDGEGDGDGVGHDDGHGAYEDDMCTLNDECPLCISIKHDNDDDTYAYEDGIVRSIDKMMDCDFGFGNSSSDDVRVGSAADTATIPVTLKRNPPVHIEYGRGMPLSWNCNYKDNELGSSWRSVASSSWRWWFVSSLKFITATMLSHPFAHLNDGACDAEWVRDDGPHGKVKFHSMLNWLLQSDGGEGDHIYNPITGYAKMRMFVLEPGPRNVKFSRDRDVGYVNIDGETVDFEPFESLLCEVHPSLVRVLC